MPSRCYIPAHAKLNLTLRVGAPIVDPPAGREHLEGYHPVETRMHAIELIDDVNVEIPTRGPSLHAGPTPVEIGRAGERKAVDDRCPVDYVWARDAVRCVGACKVASPCDWQPADDLCRRAHAALESRVGRELPVKVTVRKRVPSGAGLGGGSSNAAATLLGVNYVHSLGLGLDALGEIAATIGADVAFFLRDDFMDPPAPATARGIGEILDHDIERQNTRVALVVPAFECSTREVYRAFDELILSGHEPEGSNDLLSAALRVNPGLFDVLDAAAKAGVDLSLTGSGSAMFALLEEDDTKTVGTLEEAFSGMEIPPNVVQTRLC